MPATHSTLRRLANLSVHVVPVAGGGDAVAAVDTVTLSDELKSLAAESLIQPGHDLTQLGTAAAGKELVVTGGEGAYLLTADGTKVLDGPGGIWNVQMGYGQMKIVDAVSKQMTTLPFNSPFATIAAPAATLAKEIAKKAPADLNHVFFVTGGSEANDTAMQFIYYRNNYMGSLSLSLCLSVSLSLCWCVCARARACVLLCALSGAPTRRSCLRASARITARRTWLTHSRWTLTTWIP